MFLKRVGTVNQLGYLAEQVGWNNESFADEFESSVWLGRETR
jgi:hypothetical protein